MRTVSVMCTSNHYIDSELKTKPKFTSESQMRVQSRFNTLPILSWNTVIWNSVFRPFCYYLQQLDCKQCIMFEMHIYL